MAPPKYSTLIPNEENDANIIFFIIIYAAGE